MAQSARAYATAGLRIFPLKPNAKIPLTQHGVLDASADPDTVARWWRRWPAANIGLATGAGSFDVLDVDTKEPPDGRVALGVLYRAGLLIGCGSVVRTPTDGLHLLFQPSGLRNTTTRHHLDVRGQGGYIVAAGSRIDDRQYRVEVTATTTAPLDWVACLRLLDDPPAGMRQSRAAGGIDDLPYSADAVDVSTWMSAQPAGVRNQSLFKMACRLIRHRASPAIFRALVAGALASGLVEPEISRTIGSAIRQVGGRR